MKAGIIGGSGSIGSPRLPTRLSRRAKARTRWHWRRSERVTWGLAALALASAGTVVAGQFTRMLTRRAGRDSEKGVVEAAPAAARDTVGVALEGYTAAPRSETVLFNLLSGFLGAFGFMRISTFGIRGGWWPVGDTSIAGQHIHHFVPGILIAFGSGVAALLTEDDRVEDRLAIPMGIGIGLTFDEAALLLDLRDVYWTREGLLSVQLSLGLAAILGSAILGMRMLQRGERHQEEVGAIPHRQLVIRHQRRN
jgi:hypothetical protein